MNIRKLMKEKVSRVSISSKMSIVMTVSIVLILTVFLGVNRYYNSFFVYQKLENASLTYLDSIDRMMENLVDTLDGYSRICFSNAGVQELLDKNSSGQVDFSLQDNVNNYLWELVVNVKQIESIYLYSNNGLVASADRQSLKITLMDNGRGMSKEALKKAISGEEGRNGKSFGLFATLHRLQYCYGDRIWWSIESEENGGTTIIMKIEVEEC